MTHKNIVEFLKTPSLQEVLYLFTREYAVFSRGDGTRMPKIAYSSGFMECVGISAYIINPTTNQVDELVFAHIGTDSRLSDVINEIQQLQQRTGKKISVDIFGGTTSNAHLIDGRL